MMNQILLSYGATGPTPSQVKLLLHADTLVNSGQNLLDYSIYGRTVTKHQSVGISATAKFGAGSTYVTFGAFTNSITYFDAPDSSDLEFAGQDFCVDCWIRWANRGGTGYWSPIVSNKGSASPNLEHRLGFIRSGASDCIPYFYYSTNGTSYATAIQGGTFSPTLDTWYHFACTKSGSDLRFFINGNQSGTTGTVSGTIYSGSGDWTWWGTDTGTLGITGDSFMDELRIVVGQAVWTANFTPPTSAYT
jgi:hypothetical protein